MADPTRTVTAPDGPPTASLADPAATTGGEPGPAGPTVTASPARYQLGEPIARGGMGEVFRATDTILGREVAVKVLQDRYAPGSAVARRFLDEARITGQLQHPGIPPVHDLGTLPDGRPFLAMKLIKGETLADLLKGGRVNTLAVFEGVCQAVAYAHAHGVIHRDLKPANVMVGSFGEVQVMDWGLAKILAPGTRSASDGVDPDATASLDPTEIKSLRDADTQAGSLLGTPAFMAPEQAIGAVDQIDRRTDVFGLGGILCALLTGKPPFVGDTAESTRQLAARAKLDDAFARLGGCRAEPDLIGLAKRCLSAEKADRPADAGEVAKAIASLRTAASDRARKAEIDREKAVVEAREQRKRRRVVQWAGGLVAAVLLAGAIGTTVSLFEAQKQEGIARGEAAAKETARGEEAKQRGIAEVKRAEAEQAQEAETKAKEAAVREQAKAEKAYAKTADVLDVMVSEVTGDSLATQMVVTPEQKKFLTTVLKYYQEFAAVKGEDETTRARTAKAAHRVGMIEYRLGRMEHGAAALRRARDAHAQLVTDFPAAKYQLALAGCHNDLGLLLDGLGARAEAAEQYTSAIAILGKLSNDHRAVPNYRAVLARTHNNLGWLFVRSRRLADADSEYGKALTYQQKLVVDCPTEPDYRRDLAVTRSNLGTVFQLQRKWAKADEQFRTAVELLEKLVADFPAVPGYRKELAGSRNNLGLLMENLGRWAEAKAEYGKAITHQKKLSIDFPGTPGYRMDLAASHSNLGNTLKLSGSWPEAEVEYRRAMEIEEGLATDFLEVPSYQVNLGGSYCNFGGLLFSRGQSGDSLEWYGRAIRTLVPVHENGQRDAVAKLFLRNSHHGRALAHDKLSKHADAVVDWTRVIELSPDRERPQFRAMRATSRLKAGMISEAVTETDELGKGSGWPPNFIYDFACVYAVASTKVADRKREHADAAIEMLQKAVKAGYKDVTHMKTDPDLDPLRGRDDFKKLLADLEAKFPPTREVLPAPRRE